MLFLAILGTVCGADGAFAQPSPKEREAVDWKSKRVVFELRDTSWAKVIEWFAEQAQLPFESTFPPPDGSFTFMNSKDEKGKLREYDLTDIHDIINENLIGAASARARAQRKHSDVGPCRIGFCGSAPARES